MTTQTLPEAAKLINDEIVQGVAEDIIDLNPMFTILPFDSFTGQSITVNRELALGDAGFYSPGDQILAKNQSNNTPVTFYPTKIIGDAEVDGLVQATSSSAGVDQMTMEVMSKAKSVGRKFQQGMATGNGTLPNMNGITNLVDASQVSAFGAAVADTLAIRGEALLSGLDIIMDAVKSKDGQVDFIMVPAKVIRLYKAYLRSLGGSNPDHITIGSGDLTRTVIQYDGVPIFRNDYLPTNLGVGTNESEVFAGNFDDGTRKVGIAGIAPENNMGITVKALGEKESTDDELVRIKWYANFASFNRRGLAKLTGVFA